jgi:hypothetical protein
MIRLEDRQTMVQDIAIARSAGARLLAACLIVGITLRTLQRWQSAAGGAGGVRADARPLAIRPVPAHALLIRNRFSAGTGTHPWRPHEEANSW